MNMHKITEPLILWSGSHQAGSGKGCAMNLVSWENGDSTITDFPDCSDRMLARIVQGVNDRLADSDGRLNPEDAFVALELGHATVGTSSHELNDLELRRIYVRCAVLAASRVVQYDKTGKAQAAIDAAIAWADDSTDAANAAYAAAYAAANAAVYAAANAAFYAAFYAANAAAYSADAAFYAANAAAYSADAAYAAQSDRYWYANLAREIIDLFKELTGVNASEPPAEVVNGALRNMVRV